MATYRQTLTTLQSNVVSRIYQNTTKDITGTVHQQEDLDGVEAATTAARRGRERGHPRQRHRRAVTVGMGDIRQCQRGPAGNGLCIAGITVHHVDLRRWCIPAGGAPAPSVGAVLGRRWFRALPGPMPATCRHGQCHALMSTTFNGDAMSLVMSEEIGLLMVMPVMAAFIEAPPSETMPFVALAPAT